MKDISMLVEGIKLNIRSCIIIRNNDKVLMEIGDEDNAHYVFPGGRVKILENSTDTIDREIEEEIGINIKKCDKRLISLIENFFTYNNVEYHEIMFIYLLESKDDFGITDGSTNLDSKNSKYYWISKDKLNTLKILPLQLKEIAFSNTFKHYINQKENIN